MTPTHLKAILAEREGYAPCPTCHQYSHSLGDDAVARAYNHFHSMYAHPVRGHPMGNNFDDKTRDAAQVLATAIRNRPTPASEEVEGAETAFGISKRRHEARMADLATPSETRIAKLEAAIEAALSELNTPGHFGGTGAVGGTNGIAMRLRNTLARP